jgi:hypothetical protein
MTMPVADYDKPRALLDQLFQTACPKRVVLLSGGDGVGKTMLLSLCQSRAAGFATTVAIELRNNCVGASEILYRIGSTIGWNLLPRFARRVAMMDGAPNVRINRNWLIGMNNRINVVLSAETRTERDQRLVALTDDLFADLARCDGLFLLLFDMFEQAPSEVRDWLSGPFLARAISGKAEHIRVAIAGRDVPTPENIEWGACSMLHVLEGVREPDPWLSVIDALGYKVPSFASDQPRGFVEGICWRTRGNPYLMMQTIREFPRRDAPA